MNFSSSRLPRLSLLSIAICLALAGCRSNLALEEGNRLLAEGKPEQALPKLEQATKDKPDDIEARRQYLRQREGLTGKWLSAAERARREGRPDEAEQGYRRVLQADHDNRGAIGGLEEIAKAKRNEKRIVDALAAFEKKDVGSAEHLARMVLAENPSDVAARALIQAIREADDSARPKASAIDSPFSKPISLEFRDTPLRSALEAISRSSGLNFVLDKDIKADTRVTIFIRNSTVDEVLKLLLTTQQLERKLLNANSVLIYQNTPAKQKDYQELVVRTFYLANADVKQAHVLIKSMLKTRDVFVDEKLGLLVIRDTADAVRLAEQLIESLDIAAPEVTLDVEVLEISRTKLQELGLQFPEQIGYGRITPDVTNSVLGTSGNTISQTTTFGGALAPGNIDLHNRGGLTSYVANPAALLNLKNQDSDSRLLANPRIRVVSREKAKIHIGEKLPIFTTTSTANVGVSASVSYLDVGLKLDVEPIVHLEEDVEIKVGLEVSSIVKEVPGPSGSLAYQVGTRSAGTVLRLRDGETQVLAGLINDEERSSASRLPALGDMPLIGRLFSSQRDSTSKTEIVLLITPRVVRNIVRPKVASPVMESGTDSKAGLPPMRISNGVLRGISSSSSGNAAAPAPQSEAAEAESAPGEAQAQAEPANDSGQ